VDLLLIHDSQLATDARILGFVERYEGEGPFSAAWQKPIE
jgi:hypothetical protein